MMCEKTIYRSSLRGGTVGCSGLQCVAVGVRGILVMRVETDCG